MKLKLLKKGQELPETPETEAAEPQIEETPVEKPEQAEAEAPAESEPAN